jgi:hypothetical protein
MPTSVISITRVCVWGAHGVVPLVICFNEISALRSINSERLWSFYMPKRIRREYVFVLERGRQTPPLISN